MRLGRNVEALGFVKEHSGYNDVKSWAGKKLQWVESEGFSREIGYDSKAKVIYEKFLEPQMSAPPEQDSDFVKGLVAILESKEPGE